MSTNNKFFIGKFDFLSKAKIIVPVWTFLMFLGIVAIFAKGLDYGIDFIGGTEMQIQFQKPADAQDVRKVVEGLGYTNASIQGIGDKHEFLIRLESIKGQTDKETNEMQNAMVQKISDGFKMQFADNSVEIRRVDTVGPQVGDELKRNSLLAAFYSLLMILIYIGLRFDFKYAPSAVFCLIHDAVIMVSIFAIFDREVNVQTLASILTLMGYSLNDTIVNFDRIRENEKIHAGQNYSNIVNLSVNEMLSRTIITTITTELAVLALYFLSDGVVQQIAFTLGIGILLGAYSTIYIASPLVIWMDRIENGRRRHTGTVTTAKA